MPRGRSVIPAELSTPAIALSTKLQNKVLAAAFYGVP